MSRCAVLVLLWASAAFSQTVEVTRVESGNALSTVTQRHLVRVAPSGIAPVLLLATQRDTWTSPDGEGLHWYRSDDGGRHWRHYTRLFDDGVAGKELHFAADVLVVGNDLAVVWSYDTTVTNFSSDPSDPQRKVYFQWWRYDGAGDWTPGPRLTVGTPSSGRAFHRANIARDSTGKLWINAWYRSECPASAGVNCADAARMWVSSDGGESFSSVGDLAQAPVLGGGRVVHLGSRLLLLWGDYSWDNPARYMLHEDSAAADSWQGPFNAFSDGDSIYHGSAFNAVADGRGGMHLVYKDRREQLYYRFFDGTRFGARTFVDGEPYWTVQPAITLRGDELYVCTNHYRAATRTSEMQSRRLSDGFSSKVVLDASADLKYYPTAPERMPTSAAEIPCAYTSSGWPGTMKVALQSAPVTPPPDDPPPPPPPPPSSGTVAFQDGVAPSSAYAGTRDASLLFEKASTALGRNAEGFADGSPDATLLFSWDLRSIAPGTPVSAATIVLDVTNASVDTYELYEVRRAWDEASVTWRAPSAGNTWTLAGAQGSADRGSTLLGTFGPAGTGKYRIALSAAGVAAVQRWIDDPSTNAGVIIQDYVAATDGIYVAMRENPTASRRPRLELTLGTAPSEPSLPTVTLTAADANATEGASGDTARFRLARTGSTSAALSVALGWAGTAVPGSDYEVLADTVEIPAGSASVELTVRPLDDSNAEASESVLLSLGANDAVYLLGSARSATVTIADDDSAPPPPPPASTPVTVSFRQGALPTTGYAGARDAAIRAAVPTTNLGALASISVDGTPDESVVLSWDLTAIPKGSVIEAVTLTLRIENPSGNRYPAYALSKGWSETQVTWNQASSGSPWAAAGARGSADHGSDLLAEIGPSVSGTATYTFSSAGVAAVQRWVNDPATNFGLLVMESAGATDGLDFVTREGAVADRPMLTVRYRAP